MAKAVLGIIGGSGLYDLPGLADARARSGSGRHWGEPSDALRLGRIGETRIAFLPRHGRGHRYSPSDINYRANIDAMKRAGVTDLVSLSACGSFREDLPPGTFVLIDQMVDRTFRRETSFFGTGLVAHVSMARPDGAAPSGPDREGSGGRGHRDRPGAAPMSAWRGRNSRRSPSRSATAPPGYDVIGMTGMPEAKLAREAEITLRDRRDGDGLRLLAPGARGGAGVRHHRRAPRQRRPRPPPRRPPRAGLPRRARGLPGLARTARSTPRSSPRPRRATPR